MSAELTLLIQE